MQYLHGNTSFARPTAASVSTLSPLLLMLLPILLKALPIRAAALGCGAGKTQVGVAPVGPGGAEYDLPDVAREPLRQWPRDFD